MKEALFDVDGVLIYQQEYFSQKLARDFNIPFTNIEPFFKNEFQLCMIGQADLKEVIIPYLTRWNVKISVDKLLRIWWNSGKEIDQVVLKAVDQIRSKGIKTHLASGQEKYRANYIWEKLGLKNHFDGAFLSCQIGFKKKDPQFFQTIIEELKFEPGEISYWDDNLKNVEVAKSAGIKAYHFKDNETFLDEIRLNTI